MANSIDLVTTFLAVIDSLYKVASKTALLDAQTTADLQHAGSNEVKVMQLSIVGMGDYDRATGYPAGDVTATWVTKQLAAERGREFQIDKMDDEESLGLLLGNTIRLWMETQVAPEIDAYRFARYATLAGLVVATPTTLTSATIAAAISAGKLAMNNAEVPEEGRILFISFDCKAFLEESLTRTYTNENNVQSMVEYYDGMRVVGVPQSRFYTQVTLDAGATTSAGGFTKTATTGRDINFMIVQPLTVSQPVKLNQVKYFSPEENQSADAHKWQYRLYHDAYVMNNRDDGIYLHHKAS